MWKFEDINREILGNRQIYNRVNAYIRDKNLNFIVAGGACINRRQETLSPGTLETWLAEFAACGFSQVSFPGESPSPPFMAADIDESLGLARVIFLIDFTREAESGIASKFYSKILGAFATQFFAACPEIRELRFPFL